MQRQQERGGRKAQRAGAGSLDQQNARAYALLSPALISLALFLVAPIMFVII
jgi:ABC-type sugar transport system permease subunit